MTRTRRYALLLMVVLVLLHSIHVFAGFFWEPDVTREKLEVICESRGGLSSPGPLYVDGYYQPSSGPLFGYDEVQTRLSKARFQFFEMDTSWVKKSGTWGRFKLRKVNGEGRYTRFYLAERGDPNCAAYEQYLSDDLDSAEKKVKLRAYGVYPDHCIAALRTNELKSEYGLFRSYEADSEIPGLEWSVDEIRNVKTGEVYGSYWEFQYCLKGEKKNGRCRGGREYISYCPTERSERQEGFHSLYYETFTSTPNPILEKKLTVVEVRDPGTVPTNYVKPELIEVLEGKKNIKRLRDDEVKDLYMSMDTEGYAWIEYKDGVLPDGRVHNNAIPQLWVIREHDRRLLKIDITCLGPPRSWGWYDFCCIRAIPDDGIYFLAWGGRMEPLEKANNFKILKYSWDGELERITAGTLPFEFYAKHEKGRPVHFYAKLEIGEDEYFFSVFESDKLMNGIHSPLSTNGTQFIKEFKFSIFQ